MTKERLGSGQKQIRNIQPEDSRSTPLVQKAAWLQTYANLELGITKEDILEKIWRYRYQN